MQTRLLNTTAAAAHVRLKYGVPCAPSYLNKLRSVGGGPRFLRLGRRVVYRTEHLDEHFERRLSAPLSSTSERVRANGEELDIEMDGGDLEDMPILWTGQAEFDEITSLLHPDIDMTIQRRRGEKMF